MKITAKIIEILPEQSGISRDSRPWRKANYIVEERQGTRANTLLIQVWDGTDHRIDRLNLTLGNTYELFLDAEVSKYNDSVYNNIKCWGANQVPDLLAAAETQE